MSVYPTLGLFFQLTLVLAAGCTAIVACAALGSYWVRGAAWQRAAWQASTLALVALLVGEFTGVARGVVASVGSAVRSSWQAISIGRAERSALGVRSRDAIKLEMSEVGTRVGSAIVPGAALTAESDSAALVAADERRIAEQIMPRAPEETVHAPSHAAGADHLWRGLTGWTWVVGASLIAARLLLGRFLLLVVRRRWQPVLDSVLYERAREVARRLGLRRPIALAGIPGLSGPIAFGILRPTIGLPASFREEFDPAQQEAILAHEIAHLVARDPAWHLLADLVAAVLWWHPLAWWSRHQLRVSSEWVADEASLVVQDGPVMLATCLVELGKRVGRLHGAALARIEGNGFRSSLGHRVERLLRLPTSACTMPCRSVSVFARVAGSVTMFLIAIVCTGWSEPAQVSKGETMIESIRQSWRHSVAAVTLWSIFGGAHATLAAPAADAAAVTEVDEQDRFDKDVKSLKGDPDDRDQALVKMKVELEKLEAELAHLRAAGQKDEALKLEQAASKLREHLRASAEKIAKEKPEKQLARERKRSDESMDALLARLKELEAENARLRDAIKKQSLDGEDKKRIEPDQIKKGPKEFDEIKGFDEIMELKQRVEKLRAAGKQEEAEEIVRDLRKKRAVQDDLRKKIAVQAEQAAKAKAEENLLLAKKAEPPIAELGGMLKELREEVSRLRDEVAELRHMVRERGDDTKGPPKR